MTVARAVDPSRADGRVAANQCQTSPPRHATRRPHQTKRRRTGKNGHRMDAEEHMSEQQHSSTTLLSRIGRWFRKDIPENGDTSDLVGQPGQHSSNAIETRTTFLRPWAKRDASIQRLEEGFTTLTDLMGAIRDNLDH